MLVLEDSDDERLYLAKGIPRDWLASGKGIAIEGAPTRWGKVALHLRMDAANNRVAARVDLQGDSKPNEVHFKLRVPKGKTVKRVTVNAKAATLGGPHNDTVIFAPGPERVYELNGELS